MAHFAGRHFGWGEKRHFGAAGGTFCHSEVEGIFRSFFETFFVLWRLYMQAGKGACPGGQSRPEEEKYDPQKNTGKNQGGRECAWAGEPEGLRGGCFCFRLWRILET
jgi:hypothetical protein